jgi:N-acetylglucosaminyldiphosphoundecaprenol N-acetyl-beta-D-mannosaminyltransferase
VSPEYEHWSSDRSFALLIDGIRADPEPEDSLSLVPIAPFPPSYRVPIAGIFIDGLTLKDVLSRIEFFVSTRKPHQIITANPLMIMAAEKDSALRLAFQSADLIIPDSVGVLWAARCQGRRLMKISGIDLMENLCAEAAEKKWRVFFLGAAPGVAEETARVLSLRYPGFTLAGTHHGFFSSNEKETIRTIFDSKPDLLFVALSTPFQDGWIHKNINDLGAKVVMGVGGSFDVLSGRLRRAPAWMRAAGLEWFFRLLQEPRRIHRMFRLPLFLLKTLTLHDMDRFKCAR